MRRLSGILNGRSRSGSSQRSRITDRWTIVNEICRAERVDRQASHPRCSAGISSTIASRAPTPMITIGRRSVARVGCRRPHAEHRRVDVIVARPLRRSSTSSARLDHRVGLRHEAMTISQHRDHERSLGHLESHPCDCAAPGDSSSMISSCSRAGRAGGRDCSTALRARSGAGSDPSSTSPAAPVARKLQVPRVVDASDRSLAEAILVRELTHQQVVLVVSADAITGRHAGCRTSSTHSSLASPYWTRARALSIAR